ncbi:Os11g0224700 [Oryza sativa Japonica Group]|uniref:Os11g0224700 protein n=1 Tax=Oryza sativa subsp. japonica TaxID=39947 RepID=A0A0P0Y0E6_ORYSJ|nr:Os11g0224700 [Oryza sativa Japonica Group]
MDLSARWSLPFSISSRRRVTLRMLLHPEPWAEEKRGGVVVIDGDLAAELAADGWRWSLRAGDNSTSICAGRWWSFRQREQ